MRFFFKFRLYIRSAPIKKEYYIYLYTDQETWSVRFPHD